MPRFFMNSSRIRSASHPFSEGVRICRIRALIRDVPWRHSLIYSNNPWSFVSSLVVDQKDNRGLNPLHNRVKRMNATYGFTHGRFNSKILLTSSREQAYPTSEHPADERCMNWRSTRSRSEKKNEKGLIKICVELLTVL